MTNKISLIDTSADKFCFGSDECFYFFGYFCQNDLRFKVCTFKATINTNNQGSFPSEENYMCYTT